MTEAERWLERHHDERFFLYVDTWDPPEPCPNSMADPCHPPRRS
jgi:hypothetical protein